MPTALPLTDKTDRKMKKAILLIVAYLLVQLLCGVLIGAGVNLYAKLFAPTGAAPLGMASVPIMLCSLAAMLLVLWKLGYLKNDGRAYATGSPGQLAWGIMGGMGAIVVSTYIVELLPPLPDLMVIFALSTNISSSPPSLRENQRLSCAYKKTLQRDCLTGSSSSD